MNASRVNDRSPRWPAARPSAPASKGGHASPPRARCMEPKHMAATSKSTTRPLSFVRRMTKYSKNETVNAQGMTNSSRASLSARSRALQMMANSTMAIPLRALPMTNTWWNSCMRSNQASHMKQFPTVATTAATVRSRVFCSRRSTPGSLRAISMPAMPPSASNRPQVSQICSRWYVVGTQAMGSLAEDSPQPNRAQYTHARKSAKPMVSRQWADRFSRKRSIMRPSLVWRKYTGASLPATVEVAHQQVPDQVKR